MRLQVIEEISLTDVGRKRRHNEDAIGDVHLFSKLVGDAVNLDKKGRLYAVADGMGGYAGGEIASNLALQALFLVYYSLHDNPVDDLKQAVSAANQAVYQAGDNNLTSTGVTELDRQVSFKNNLLKDHSNTANQEQLSEEPDQPRMGTTLTTALVLENTLYTCNVGDSRIYLLRKGKLNQLTRDHSLIGEGVRQGILTKEQARTSPFNNIITRALGLHTQVEADLTETSLQTHDTVMLCSDGLYRAVDEISIEQALAKMTPGIAAHYLVNAANISGGPDNISVVIVKMGQI